MTQLQKYTWLIDTIRRAGKISLEELSDSWSRNRDLNDEKPLSRSTFNRWRDAIYEQFGIMIDCQKVGGYLYYISNPEDIDEDKLKKWMLDSFAVGNIIGENLSLKNRILVDEIPSSREYLSVILEAMKDNRQIEITYLSSLRIRATPSRLSLIALSCTKIVGICLAATTEASYESTGSTALKVCSCSMLRSNCQRTSMLQLFSQITLALSLAQTCSPSELWFAPSGRTNIICSRCRYTIRSDCLRIMEMQPTSSYSWRRPTILP